jgi:hypothetical protein
MTPAAPAWPEIDWRQPAFAPCGDHGRRALACLREGAAVHQALRQAAGASPAPRFVPQAALPAGEPYESFIHRTGAVPTRDNLHDLFNGLVWRACPQAKRRLNELQATEIVRRGVGPTRGPLRDALTLFDENGAVLDAPLPLWQALLARDWRRLFAEGRALWRQARLMVFGHALLEQLATLPRKGLTAHVLCAPAGAAAIAPEDGAIAQALQPAHLAAKPFAPLPVLGVPGWCAANEAPVFYDDPAVFRPARRPPPAR